MKKALALVFALALILSLSACAPRKDTVNISAAASLTDVLAELAARFQTENPAVDLSFTFDSSGTLQTQIEEGAPCDLFFSAAQKQMDALDAQGLIDTDSRVNLLENKVVLIRPALVALPGETISFSFLGRFQDLADSGVKRVAIGGESVPVGQYTREIFEYLGIWDAVSPKAVFGTNVRSVLTWVENGEVDCGVVYATDAATSDKVTVVCQAPEGSCQRVIYPAALVKNCAHPAQAQAFLDFLQTDGAIAIFEAAGFAMAQI